MKVMPIIEDYPPNYDKIKAVFPDLEASLPLFCYNGSIYNPFKVKVYPDLHVHERVHVLQQGDNTEGWYDKYLSDLQFRLDQEIEAYGVQYKFLSGTLPSKILKQALHGISTSLAGPLYGNLLTYNQAESKVRHFAKELK